MLGSSINKETRICGIVNNVKQHLTHYTASPTSNYWTPLTSQVKELGLLHEQTSLHHSSQHKGASTKSALSLQPSSNSYVKSIRGDINSAVFDTGATSSCGRTGDKFQATKKKTDKIFHIPTGKTTAASTQAKLYHDVREPVKNVDMVPELKHNLLISGGKLVDANYITFLTRTEVLIYDGNDIHISVSKEAIL